MHYGNAVQYTLLLVESFKLNVLTYRAFTCSLMHNFYSNVHTHVKSMFTSTVLLSSLCKDLENQLRNLAVNISIPYLLYMYKCLYQQTEQFLQHRQHHQLNGQLLYLWAALYIWPHIISVPVHHNSPGELRIIYYALKSYTVYPLPYIIASILSPGPLSLYWDTLDFKTLNSSNVQ